MARDETPVDPSALAVFGAAQMQQVVLRPHVSARWTWFDRQPIYTIWQRNRAAGPIDETEIDWHGEGALIVRPQDSVRWIGIDLAGCALLDACAEGRTLAEAGVAALRANPDADLATLGAQLFAIGAFGQASLDEVTIGERRT